MERECKKKTKMLPGAMIYKSMYCIINFFLKKNGPGSKQYSKI